MTAQQRPTVFVEMQTSPTQSHLLALADCATQQLAQVPSLGTRSAQFSSGILHRMNVSVWFQDAFDFAINDDSSRITIGLNIYVRIHWKDDILLNESFSCSDVYIPGLVAWSGTLPKAVTPETQPVFSLGPTKLWSTVPPDHWQMEFSSKIVAVEMWKYTMYPFDQQHLSIHLSFTRGDALFADCEHHDNYKIVDRNSMASEMPTGVDFGIDEYGIAHHENEEQARFLLADEWILPPDWLQLADYFAAHGAAGYRCDMTIALHRNPVIHMVKDTSLDILVVVAGLAASFMNPKNPPYFGARLGTTMTAMLMSINKSVRRDLGLGRLGYMLVLDWFAIFNVITLLVMMLLTIHIHVLLMSARTSLAMAIDRVARIFMFATYFFGNICFLISLTSGDGTATLVWAISFASLLIGGSCAYVWVTLRRRYREMRAIADSLLAQCTFAGEADSKRDLVLERLFAAFDSDRSGTLDKEEVGLLLSVLDRRLRGTSSASTQHGRRLSLFKRDGDFDAMLRQLHLEVPGGITLEILKDSVAGLIKMRDYDRVSYTKARSSSPDGRTNKSDGQNNNDFDDIDLAM